MWNTFSEGFSESLWLDGQKRGDGEDPKRSAMKKRKPFCVFGLILLCFSIPLVAAHWKGFSLALAAKPPRDKIPAPLLKWPEKGSEYAILVDKSLQRVFVYHKSNPYKPYRTYACSTGENEGPKVRENDRKTPEGMYFFIRAFDKKELLPIYGSHAFVLDYPNVIDRREGKKGHGIWFHGLNRPLKPRDTNGCVALENADIDDLANFIRIEDTPAIVSEKIEMVDPSEMEKQLDEVLRLIETWRSSWERKDIDKYMSVYSPDFTASGKNWQQWKDHKARLARHYKKIRVDVQNLRVLQNDGLVLASFVQRYSNEYFSSAGRKTLYLKHGSRLRIIGESFEGAELKPSIKRELPAPEEGEPVRVAKDPEAEAREVPAVAPMKEVSPPGEETNPAVSKKESLTGAGGSRPRAIKEELRSAEEKNNKIRKMLDSWKKAWERKNLPAYMAFYDRDFQSRGMDFKAWKKHREKLNQKYRSITVSISDLKIKRTSPVMATVDFTQKYEADDYKDKGLKSLLLVKKGKDWKIREEEWKPLDQESRP
jgi:murein L,D-transpeptidase YafK